MSEKLGIAPTFLDGTGIFRRPAGFESVQIRHEDLYSWLEVRKDDNFIRVLLTDEARFHLIKVLQLSEERETLRRESKVVE